MVMAKHHISYPSIDMYLTGQKLKQLIKDHGYSVKYIQNFLQLSCPQPVYRWFKGEILPSVDHLYRMSRLLDVHMEDLIVPKYAYAAVPDFVIETKADVRRSFEKRILAYYQQFCA